MLINLIYPFSLKVEEILFHNTSKLNTTSIKSNEGVLLQKISYERENQIFEVIWNPHDYLIKSDFKLNLLIHNDDVFKHYSDLIKNKTHTENLICLIPEPLHLNNDDWIPGMNTQIYSNQIGYDFKMILTQILYYWNTKAPLRWFYEFKDINDRLNFKYKFGFNWGRLDEFRLNLSIALERNLANEIYISSIADTPYQNDVNGESIWENLNKTNPPNNSNENFGFDYFFRIIPKSEILIVDETPNLKSQSHFLTEKTFGCILANKPFIPTDKLTLELLKKHGFEKEYPFEKEIKSCKKNIALFTDFINRFNQNYDNNLYLLKEWTNDVHEYFLDNINQENSFLNYFRV